MRKLLGGIFTVALVAALLVFAAPMLVPVDALRTRLSDAVRGATGRELRIAGPMRLTLLPHLAVQADDVTFANAPGGQAPEMARLKTLAVELHPWPLLHGRIEVVRLVLTEPVIALEVDRNGRGNWVFASKPDAEPTAATQPAPTQAAPTQPAPTPTAPGGAAREPADLHLDDVHIVGGRVTWLDQRNNTTQLLDKIDASLSLPGLAGPLGAEGSAVWNGQKVTLALTAAAPGKLLAGGESAVSLKLDAAPVQLRLDGTLTGLPPARVAGTVDLAFPSLRDFAAWTGTKLAVSGNGLGPLTIKGRLSRAGDEIAFTDAEIALDAMHAKGALTVATGGARPRLTGKLDVDVLDINPYLPGPQPQPHAGQPAPAGQAAEAGWSDAPIDLSGLRAVDAELDLSAGGIRYRQLRIDATRLALRLNAGRLAADFGEIALYQGAGNGRLDVDASGAVPAIGLSVALDRVQIEPLLAAAAGIDRLSGTGRLNLDVAARGASQRALIGALDGKGALSLADGVVKGVNLLALAQRVVPGAIGADGGEHTTFGSLTATFTIDKGVLHNSDLLLKTRVAPISGAGTVNLPARTIDYVATAQIGGSVKVPIQITGPLDHPTYRPEPAGTAEQILRLVPGSGGSGAQKPADLLRRLLPR